MEYEVKDITRYNGQDCPFQAYITNLEKYNEGVLDGEWVTFPTTYEKLQEIFNRIGIGKKNELGVPYEEYFISDYSCNVSNLSSHLDEYENLDELNYFAVKLNDMELDELHKFEETLKVSDYTSDLDELINLTDNLNKYNFYPEVTNDQDLGYLLVDKLKCISVPDEIKMYFDYEAYGRDTRINEGDCFTENGYVVDNEKSFERNYDREQKNLPDEYKVTSKPKQSEPAKSEEQDKVNNITRQQMIGRGR